MIFLKAHIDLYRKQISIIFYISVLIRIELLHILINLIRENEEVRMKH